MDIGRWALGAAALAALAGARDTPLQRFEAVEPHMGTLVRITLYAADAAVAREAFRRSFDRIRDLDRTLSDYRPDSELNAITTSAVGRPVAVGDDLFAVLRASQALAEATGGKFDVTEGPVIRLWREARATSRLPDAAALTEARSRSGFRHLHLDAERRTVRLDLPRMALDVGAIGKGYAASEALDVLSRLGVSRALVAISGDLAMSGPPPGQRGWRVAIDSAPGDDRYGLLELTNAAVSTAGNSRQHADIGGRRYSHIVDPQTGLGLEDDLTVTVVAPRGLEADGLDTAVSLLGAERGLALIESSPGAAGLIAVRSGASTTLIPSSRFVTLAAAATSRPRAPGSSPVSR